MAQLSDDVLREIMMKLPFKELMKVCNSSIITAKICSSKSFWAIKSEKDFGVSTSDFYKNTGDPRNVYGKYKEISDIQDILLEIYKFANMELPPGKPIDAIMFRNTEDINLQISKISEIYANSSKSAREIVDKLAMLKVLPVPDQYKNRVVDPDSIFRSKITVDGKDYLFGIVEDTTSTSEQKGLMKTIHSLYNLGPIGFIKINLTWTVFIHLARLGKRIPGFNPVTYKNMYTSLSNRIFL